MSEHRVIDNADDSRFELLAGDKVAGFAEYHETRGALAVAHTVVEPRSEGQAIDAARVRGLGVLPYCPFIRSWIQRQPDYLDPVPADRRAWVSLSPEPPNDPP